jgi:hypothetical protein
MPAGVGKNGNPSAQTHGLYRLKDAVKTLGRRVIDRRTSIGKALARWRGDLIRDLGGQEAVSTQKLAVVDLAVKTKLLLDSIDAWLLVQPSLIHLKKRALLPVVRERQALADALARYMGQLGLERKAREIPSLQQWLEQRAAAAETENGATSPTDAPQEGADAASVPDPGEAATEVAANQQEAIQ